MPVSTRSSDATVAQKAEEVAHESSQLLQGQVPISGYEDYSAGHPIHPATVHWPIAFLTLSFGITSLDLLPLSLYPTSVLPPRATLGTLALYSAGAGVVSALPAIITGAGEAYELVRKEYKEKGENWGKVIDSAFNMKDTGGRKVKMTVKHASLNDMVVGLAAYNWYRGVYYPGEKLPQITLLLNAIALPALLYSAMLGGRLVYEYAMGIQRQGHGKEVKEKAG
ncbi:uncharacterized protein I303_101429 [Kwoniella dejecticola CBS 10117]|uniref:DUF2231 domain-containing protein n=1 Tax=Kwoniella dejecticola CBS 10117 TaxID=1296121 RepID=A0A1A6AHR5_9TREE|nr:uncharacterized protein I303_01438 [Kwoniella dejecticola CBS 10117]OBR89609.1 hypothetical protein I303_01438 [Kwoniella dejecticola CBS 10117]